MSDNRITIFDTTLRDGEQSPGCSMNLDEKVLIAGHLDRLGVDVIEAGFPIASDGDFRGVQAVAACIRRPKIAALARCTRKDIDRAWEAIRGAERPRIHIFLATSDIHLQYKLKISRHDALAQSRDAVTYARTLCDDVEFSPEDATRSDPEFLNSVLEGVIEAGATTLNIPDTVGYTVPSEFTRLIANIRERVRGIEKATISVHCHNDLGLAVANSLAAIEAGARQVECTVNGIGERAGNAALEEIVMAMRVRADRLPFTTGIRTEHISPASQALSAILGFPVQPNKAIVGCNAFAHEAGIHQHGVLSNPLCYEIMTPESVGLSSNRIVLGKHSGRHALARRYAELGHPLAGDELNSVYQRFTELADRKKNIYDRDLIALLPRRGVPPSPPIAGAAQAYGD
ncbi:MAG: 2-isopropylmalate synthase [Acidobacteriia bacterium]|nr:2-isopropylmalate synthase [Terriglobia bacterium]